MKNPFLVLTPCLLACSLLAGCSSGPACGDTHPYTQSIAGPRLKAPPGLTLPAPDPAYVILPPSTTSPAATPASGACMVNPPNVLPPPALTKVKPVSAAPVKSAEPAATPPPSAASHAPPPVAAGRSME
ncbi:MAG TPA: hypothetical protein VKT74_02305 [Gammaproteobacteria bacterium]|nr:hypothetical protein [Gammaproteobacteria bacterium]